MLKGLALKSHISSHSPARVPRHSPRSRVGLVCSSMRNFLAGVIECARIWFFIAISRSFFRQGRAEQTEFLSDATPQACLADGYQPQGPPPFLPRGSGLREATRPFWHPGTLGGPFRLPGTVKPREHQADGTNFTFVPCRCLNGASSVAKLHSVQVNADRRDDDTWLTWLSSLPRLTGSSGAGKLRAPRSVPITRCSQA